MSNSSGGFLTLAEGVCDPTNNVTFDLTVRYTESRISVGVAGSDVVVLSPPPSVAEIQQLLLTIGNAPGRLIIVVGATGLLPFTFSFFPFQKTCHLEKACSSCRVLPCCPLQLQLV